MKTTMLCLFTTTFLILHPLASGEINLDKNGVAISGYNPVAYFTESKPTLGEPRITFTHEEAKYHFSRIDNRKLFMQNL